MLFLHLLFPKGNGIIDPAFGAGSSPKSKAVPQTGIHMKLRIDPGLLHGFESRLHDPPVGDAVPVTDTGIGGGSLSEYSLSPVYCMMTVPGRGRSPPPKASGP